MAFLTPLFLFGLLALAVPILIHLQRRHEIRAQRFPSLMFLESIEIPTMRRRWIRNWLLLALRCLAILLLALAFARPWLSGGDAEATAGGRGRSLVVLLDISFSMGFEDRWGRAVQAADSALASVTPSDEASIVVFADVATALGEPSSDSALLRETLSKVKPSSRKTRYGPALRMARKLLLESDRPFREVVLVTDFQRTGWEREERARLPVGTELRIVDLSGRDQHGPSPSNLAVASVVFDRVELGDLERIELQARVVNLGSAPLTDVEATLVLNGRDLERRALELQPDETRVVAFQGFSLPEGLSRGVVRLSGDALATDNDFSFVLDRSQALSVLVVEGPRVAGPSSGFYVTRSLQLDREPPIRLRSIGEGRLSADHFETAGVVFLSDVALPGGQTAEGLLRFVEDGGGLFLALGSRSNESRHASLAEAGLVPRLTGPPVRRGSNEAAARISFFDRGYPGFEDFSAPRSGDFGTARFFRYHRVQADPQIDHVLARFEDGQIALLERQFGKGRVLVWTSTLDRYWNDFALKPIFVPFLHQSVRRLSRHEAMQPWHEVGELIDLKKLVAPPETPEDQIPILERVVDPEGERWDPRELLTLEKGGFYELHLDSGAERVIAVNLDTRESDLSTLDPEEFAAAVAAPEPVAAGPGMSAHRSAEEIEAAQGLWRYLVAALLLLLIGETLLSNRKVPA